MESDSKLEWAVRLGALLTTIPKWAAYAVIAWQIRLSIEALSGKNAGAALLTRFERQTTSWELICWVAGFMAFTITFSSEDQTGEKKWGQSPYFPENSADFEGLAGNKVTVPIFFELCCTCRFSTCQMPSACFCS
jgi:hypothetical protein